MLIVRLSVNSDDQGVENNTPLRMRLAGLKDFGLVGWGLEGSLLFQDTGGVGEGKSLNVI